jgi:THO complex subunit 4
MTFLVLTSPGQPIRLIAVPTGPARPRNPFDTAVAPSRPLAERITVAPGARSRSLSPARHTDVSGPVPVGIDRYVPGKGSRSRSPMPRRREGRPPGVRRERGERRGGARDGGGGTRRPRKTQEELDAEMEDYWGSGGAKENGDAVADAATGAEGDIEMAE